MIAPSDKGETAGGVAVRWLWRFEADFAGTLLMWRLVCSAHHIWHTKDIMTPKCGLHLCQ